MNKEDELADLKLQVSTLASQLSNSLGMIQSLKDELSQYKASISKYLSLIQGHSEEAKRVYEDNKKLSSLIISIQDEFARNLTTSHKTFIESLEFIRKSVDDSLDSQKNLKAIVDSTVSKIETVALDARNAVIKAGRNDIVLNLHHQKFDNVFLKLKNLELMRQ